MQIDTITFPVNGDARLAILAVLLFLDTCCISFPESVLRGRKYLGLFNPAKPVRPAGLQTRYRAGLQSTAQVYGGAESNTDPRVGPAISWTRFYPHFELCLRRPQTRQFTPREIVNFWVISPTSEVFWSVTKQKRVFLQDPETSRRRLC